MEQKLTALRSYLKSSIIPLALLVILFANCKQKEEKKVVRDTTITPKNAVTRLYVDSAEMEKYIAGHQL